MSVGGLYTLWMGDPQMTMERLAARYGISVQSVRADLLQDGLTATELDAREAAGPSIAEIQALRSAVEERLRRTQEASRVAEKMLVKARRNEQRRKDRARRNLPAIPEDELQYADSREAPTPQPDDIDEESYIWAPLSEEFASRIRRVRV